MDASERSKIVADYLSGKRPRDPEVEDALRQEELADHSYQAQQETRRRDAEAKRADRVESERAFVEYRRTHARMFRLIFLGVIAFLSIWYGLELTGVGLAVWTIGTVVLLVAVWKAGDRYF